MAPESELKKMASFLRWILGIMVPFMMILAGGAIRAEVKANDLEKRVQTINDDYTPLFVMEGIVGSNDKLINILNVLSQTTKDDPRYVDAIKERTEFQREILNRAALSKRGGGGPGNQKNQ